MSRFGNSSVKAVIVTSKMHQNPQEKAIIYTLLVLMRRLVVIFQHILSPVVLEIANDGMDVVGVILRIIVLNDKRRAVQTIVMWVADFQPTGPGEVDMTKVFFDRG